MNATATGLDYLDLLEEAKGVEKKAKKDMRRAIKARESGDDAQINAALGDVLDAVVDECRLLRLAINGVVG